MVRTIRRHTRIHSIGRSLLLVAATSSAASANEFSDDTLVQASALAVNTSFINSNPFKGGPFRWADTAHHACFLTGISGDFNDSSQRAYIYQDRGYWAVGVTGGTGNGIYATASCVTIPDESYQWPPPTSPGTFWYQEYFVPMKIILPTPGTGYSWTCFLTQVRGGFKGAGERVEVYQSGDSWVIGGNSSSTGVMGEARCVYTKSKSARFLVSQDRSQLVQMEYAGGTNYSEYPNNYSYTYPNKLNNCFLQRMMGRFEGLGERIQVVADAQSLVLGWPNFWWLKMSSQQSGVSGAAQCVE